MFFTHRLDKATGSGKKIAVTAQTEIALTGAFCDSYLKDTIKEKIAGKSEGVPCKKITFAVGIPADVKAEIEKTTPVSGNSEEHAVVVGEEIFVYATEEKGLLYGISVLLHLVNSDELSERLIYDYPVCGVRGYRVFLPGRKNIGVFKNVVDLLAYYKYNAIMLEIGGAMEYKKHPEINEEWVKFCEKEKEIPGYWGKVKASHYYMKNALHFENGDGGFLTQDECRELAAYCRERGLDVIPECPTLSHCDYMLFPHPEFAERQGDLIPDTYCPNHPGIYDYVFEVLGEVIDVFQPTKINIGHDEFYSMCICDRCKGLDPVDLYIEDIKKISAFLESRGVETYMWGEKMLKAVSPRGSHYGGWYTEKVYPDGTRFQVPDFYHCATKMPKNVTYINWYWYFTEDMDKVYHENGYKVIYGNFSAIQCPNFRNRVNWGTNGGFISNWGFFEDEYMQRNCQYYTLISSAYCFWCDDYQFEKAAEIDAKVMLENYNRHYLGIKNPIKVVHTTDHVVPYHEFWNGPIIIDEEHIHGHYKMTYVDGESVFFPVKHGKNITDWYAGGESDADLADRCGSSAYCELSGSSLPIRINDKFWYECQYENPHPEKEVKSFEYIPAKGMEHVNIFVRSVKL